MIENHLKMNDLKQNSCFWSHILFGQAHYTICESLRLRYHQQQKHKIPGSYTESTPSLQRSHN